MSTSSLSQLFFIGLPGSGKTTFLAALWHVLDDQSSKTSLRLTGFSGDRAYLNTITEAWRSCLPIDRTTLQTEEDVSLHLEGDSLGKFELVVPDLSGETFELQLTDRRMITRHNTILQQAIGIILFLHPDVQKGTPLNQVRELELTLKESYINMEDDAEDISTLIAPWSIEKMPTQVKLVELIQFIIENAHKKIRIAVIISAWDLVENLGWSPIEFISHEMPLFQQFLNSNQDLLEHEVFGISAQGGKIPDEKKSLLELDATDRIKVCCGVDISRDITRPIAWLLGAT